MAHNGGAFPHPSSRPTVAGFLPDAAPGSRVTGAREIERVDDLVAALRGGESLAGLRLQSLDLTGVASELLERQDLHGLVVLGGQLPPSLAAHLLEAGAIVFPAAPDAPMDPYRGHLYTPAELYDGLDRGYGVTVDARAYAWSRDAATTHDVYASALRALHDDAMADALAELLEQRSVVGVMGGHATSRGSDAFARAALLGTRLAQDGLVVATGGGPGSMEAANLGALAAGLPEPVRSRVLEEVLAALAAVPSFRPDVAAWVRPALEAREQVVASYDTVARIPFTVGMPTWFYGHEPSNVFASAIAKFFSNAIREDGLLAACDAGIIVLPGAAGTVQEIFQAVTPRYYGTVPQEPVILVGVEYWTKKMPVWALLETLAEESGTSHLVKLVDDVDEAADLVRAGQAG